jgi:hypothetical protein
MTELEARLENALKAETPPARDPMFRIRVMERREQAVLRRRVLAGAGVALGASVLAVVGFVAVEALASGPERLAMLAAGGALVTTLMAAPYLGGRAALRGLAARASWTLRALPVLRLWS